MDSGNSRGFCLLSLAVVVLAFGARRNDPNLATAIVDASEGPTAATLSWASTIPPGSPVGFVLNFDKLEGTAGQDMTMEVSWRDDNQNHAGTWQLVFDDGQSFGFGPCGGSGPPLFSTTITYKKPAGVHEIDLIGESPNPLGCQNPVLSRVVLLLNKD